MFARRIISSMLLLAFLAASIGMPVPQRSERSLKHSGEDYPCRAHRCGCFNAEICRINCCCFKPEPVVSCCRTRTAPAETAVELESAEDDHPIGLVIGALGCKGVTTFWMSLGLVFRPPACTSYLARSDRIERIIPRRDDDSPQSTLHPETPPPRA